MREQVVGPGACAAGHIRLGFSGPGPVCLENSTAGSDIGTEVPAHVTIDKVNAVSKILSSSHLDGSYS